ncbi:MAG: hypothetical protein R2729_29625 [Bryobacteraceae bacterium]
MEHETKLRFELASTPALRALYYALRGREYLKHWGVPGMETPDVFDESGEIVVALEGESVVGGGRLNLSPPESAPALPLESGGVRLRASLPEVDWARTVAAEFSRHAVDSTSSNQRAISTGLAEALFGLAAERCVDLGFSMCPAPVVRINRMHARRAGVVFHEYDVRLPSRHGIEMHLCGYTGLAAALKEK